MIARAGELPFRLVVMARHPVIGQGKTRLAAGVGKLTALCVYKGLLAITARRLGAAYPAETLRDQRIWSLAGRQHNATIGAWQVEPQKRGDLGHRMGVYFDPRSITGPALPTVIVGTDCADITLADIHKAVQLLQRHEVVFGPASDGGFWLVGARPRVGLERKLFTDVRWSHARTLADCRRNAARHGLRVATSLPTRDDCDTTQDLNRIRLNTGDRLWPFLSRSKT